MGRGHSRLARDQGGKVPKGTRFEAPRLARLTRDHDDHSGAATMRGTGAVVQMSGDHMRLITKAWGVEYRCDVCKEIVVQMDTDVLDLIREALRANGLETV